jgi:riboflavin kinase/FMN adenylyltransferase
MIVIKSIRELQDNHNETNVQVTIGNFDGVHRGHRDFLSKIKQDCKKSKAKFLVITFVPHPVQILRAQTGFLINTFPERRELLSECGVDYLMEIDFTRDFSTLSPQDFLEKFVFVFSGIEKLYLGHDFAFGANKSGNYNVAKDLCDKYKVHLVLQDEFQLEAETISSSIVRSEISSGHMEKVESLLGRKYFLSGRVIKGEGRGRQIGFPTANLGYDKELIVPQRGVYVTQTTFKDLTYNSVTNIGFNPTFNSGNTINIETHLLDFNRDIYGEIVRVSFVKKLRDEKKFSSVNDLINQIEQDVHHTRAFYSHV